MEIIKNPNFDFIGKAKYFVALSVARHRWPASSGSPPATSATASSSRAGPSSSSASRTPPEVDKIRDAVTRVSPGAVIQTYGDPKANKVLVRISQEAPETDLDAPARAVRQALADAYGQNPILESSSEIVGPIVGAELRQKAILLTVLGPPLPAHLHRLRGSRAGSGALGATIAALHDVLIALGFLAFFRFEITLNVIAALLTLVGYSVNDTIVIFDRARENLPHRRKDPMAKILNDSLNQTLTRTIISNGTTFLAVLGLFLFGGEVLRGFGFTMVVGILVGTYSTLFIAVPLVSWWYGRQERAGASAKAA